MAGSNLPGRREFGKQGVYRGDMKRGNKFFQFREKDGNKPGDRLFELGAFLDLIKTITGE